MKEPKAAFSVLMAVYLKEHPLFLRAALDSLQQQILKADEIVIVKDGPLTGELDGELTAFIQRYPGQVRIRALEKNVGLGEALRLGLEWCTHEIVARADSDDINKPQRFDKQVMVLTGNPEISVVGSAIEEFLSIPGDLARCRACAFDDLSIKHAMRFKNPLNHMTCVFRKSEVLRAGSYREMVSYEDYYLWYRMARLGCKFMNLPDVLVYARAGNDLFGRRRGWRYLQSEFAFFGIMRREGYISWWLYWANLLPRSVLRLAPKFLLKGFYALFLRKTRHLPMAGS